MRSNHLAGKRLSDAVYSHFYGKNNVIAFELWPLGIIRL